MKQLFSSLTFLMNITEKRQRTASFSKYAVFASFRSHNSSNPLQIDVIMSINICHTHMISISH